MGGSKRIAIMGAGAIGANVGGLLAHHGFDVTLIDQWPEHIEAIKRLDDEVHSRPRTAHPRIAT